MTAASWQVFNRDITLRMEEEGKPNPRKLVTAQDVGEGVVYKDDTVTVTALKVPHSPFLTVRLLLIASTHKASELSSQEIPRTSPLATFSEGADILVHEAVHEPSVAKLADSIWQW